MIYTALHNRLLAITLAIFIFFLVATLAAWKVTTDVVTDQARSRFFLDSAQIQNSLQERINLYILALEGVRNFAEMSDTMTADRWSSYVKRLGLLEKYPDISSISFVEGTIVKFIEPLAGREKALGYDLNSDEIRRTTVELAKATQQVVTTGKFINVNTNAPGFALYAPTFDPTSGKWKGFVTANFRGTEIFRKTYGRTDPFPYLDFEIYDSDDLVAENRLYDHDPLFQAVGQSGHHLTTQESIKIATQKWTVAVTTKNNLGLTYTQEILPLVVLVSGLLCCLIFLAFFLYQYRLHLASHKITDN